MASDFGKKLQRIMDYRGVSRKELAAGAGITEVAVGRYISGEREPKAITVSAIADVLDTTVDELMGRPSSSPDDIDGALRLIARNAGDLTPEEKRFLIDALISS